jgi:hypothetical protein
VRGNGSASRRSSNDGAKRVAFSDDVSTKYTGEAESGKNSNISKDYASVDVGCPRSSRGSDRGASRSIDSDTRRSRDEMDADVLEDFADESHTSRCQRRCTPWPSEPLEQRSSSPGTNCRQATAFFARRVIHSSSRLQPPVTWKRDDECGVPFNEPESKRPVIRSWHRRAGF